MRKQTKLAVVLSAVAVLALGCVATFAKGWVQVNGQWFYENASGEFVTEKIESSGNSKFYLGEDGAMVTDTFVEDYDSNGYSYYFGSNGAMVTNTWVAIDPSIVANATDNAPSAYWYYFGSNGKSYKASTGVSKKTIDGKKYAFNENGQMLTGWFDDNGDSQDEEDDPFYSAVYYAGGENDGVLRTGWVAYYDGTELSGDTSNKDYSEKDVLWFFFKSNYKKQEGGTKTISGKKYAFEANSGIMRSEWVAGGSVTGTGYKYYSADTDGHMVKKGWIYAVPDEAIDAGKHEDDEEVWTYAKSSGFIEKNKIAKINGKYYAFNKTGVMQKGLVAFQNGEYQYTVDLEETEVDDLLKSNKFHAKKRQVAEDTVEKGSVQPIFNGTGYYVLHYFGDNGDRKTGEMTLEFADDEATFYSDNNGGKNGYQSKKKKYYHNGLLCKASSDIKFGLVLDREMKHDDAQLDGWTVDKTAQNSSLIVVTTSGAKALNKSSDSAVKKDADGNYWVIKDGKFKFITTTEVKYASFNNFITTKANYGTATKVTTSGKIFQFKGNVPDDIDKDTGAFRSSKEGWIPFAEEDYDFGSGIDSTDICSADSNQYQMKLDDLDSYGVIEFNNNQGYNLNFRWE